MKENIDCSYKKLLNRDIMPLMKETNKKNCQAEKTITAVAEWIQEIQEVTQVKKCLALM